MVDSLEPGVIYASESPVQRSAIRTIKNVASTHHVERQYYLYSIRRMDWPRRRPYMNLACPSISGNFPKTRKIARHHGAAEEYLSRNANLIT